MNRWGIPNEVEFNVKARDTKCVYCAIEFSTTGQSRCSKPSWEHIVNDIKLNGEDNIAICCVSCNSSKGSKLLQDWLKSDYCLKKGIDANSVADVVKKVLARSF